MARNQENIEEERQHNLQKANLMVFGVPEGGRDEEFAKDRIEDLGVKAEVKYTEIMIGNFNAVQVRPIKIITGSYHQQYLIIQNLVCFFHVLYFIMTSLGNHKNELTLNTIFHVLLLSITFVPSFMIVACSSRYGHRQFCPPIRVYTLKKKLYRSFIEMQRKM